MKMHSKTLIRLFTLIAVAVLVGLVGTSTGQAATIASCASAGGTVTPGNTIFPPDCTGSDSGVLLADMVSPFTYSTTAGTNTGTIESAVYQDADGGLDFYYQLTNDASSSTALARLTANSFLGFSTSLATILNGSTLTGTAFIDGTFVPASGDSNAVGSVIGFSFSPPLITNEISPGSSSVVMIISTNATMFTLGNASVIDGGTDTVAAFQPFVVPEPTTFALLGLGLLGFAGLRRRLS